VALLAMPRPFSFELTTERFRVFSPDLANLWSDGALYRVVDGREVRIAEAEAGVDVEPLDERIATEVRTLLGAAFDLDEFRPRDPILRPVVRRLHGFRPPIAPDPFEMLVGAVTAQQISLRAALAVRNRFIERFGVRGDRAYAFPTRERTGALAPEDLTAVGFSRRKAECVLGLARTDVDFAALSGLPDDEVKATLVELPGVGEWTADWFLARHLARPRAWPAGDLALRYAVSEFYGDGRVLSIKETRELGARFDPFQNLTAHYLLVAHRSPG
jgi:DNA-3-methyladenine glycosylase II